ncbi:MAG: MotA/TolQ/ExbB proton channel family protein [Verrucomicrobia bacterium]|nr:MotA/TolQ/ExbB proton channel family protein [Verrucomicrobiota bacterium]
MTWFAASILPLLAQATENAPTPAASAVASATAASSGSAQATLLKLLQAGGWVMIPLGIASILTVALALACVFSLRRSTVVSRRFMETAEALLRKRDYLGLIAIANRHSEAIARITARALDFATKNPSATPESIRELAETEGARIASSLNSRVVYLADIATLSPMLGLLGTVIGIINAFGILASNTSQPRPLLLAGGVSEALVATATGLIIGIVAMSFYSLFRARVASMVSDLESATSHIVNVITAQQPGRRPQRTKVFEGDEV